MENTYTLYMHKNKINGKVYIGITKQNPIRRWANGKGYQKNEYFSRAIEKYGWYEGFEHLILKEHLSQEEACSLEKEYIKKYDALNPNKGYNLKDGGSPGPSSFEKVKEWHNNNKKFGIENKNSKKVRCIQTGEIFGSISEAARWCDSTKVGECCRGNRKHAGAHPQTGEKLSWEYVLDEEITKANVIECHQKQENQYKHLAYSSGKKVLCIETNEIFLSEADACKAYGASRGTIGRACNGKRQTALKKHWKWIE